MKSTHSHAASPREQLSEVTAGDLTAVQGGGVNDFPWETLRKAINEFLGRPTNPMPGPRSVCIPA